MNPANSANSANSPSSASSTKIAILGAGGWGNKLVRVFCELLGEDAVTIVDPDAARRNAMKSEYPGSTVTESPPWSELDAAVIAAPAPLHYQLASEALDLGLHVLVEKPLALTSKHVYSLIERAKVAGRILMVDHLLEYHPAVTRLKSLVDEGRLGNIQHMTFQRLNLGVIRSEENAWWSLAPHDVSIALHLMNEQPIEVSAISGTYLQEGIPDVVHTTLRFERGEIAHIHVSWLDPVKTRRMTIAGSKAMAVFDDVAPEKLRLWEDGIVFQNGRYAIRRVDPEVLLLPDSEPLRAMAKVFLESIESGAPPRSDGWDGLRVVRVMEAVQTSMDQHGQPIKLANEEDEWSVS